MRIICGGIGIIMLIIYGLVVIYGAYQQQQNGFVSHRRGSRYARNKTFKRYSQNTDPLEFSASIIFSYLWGALFIGLALYMLFTW